LGRRQRSELGRFLLGQALGLFDLKLSVGDPLTPGFLDLLSCGLSLLLGELYLVSGLVELLLGLI
jgi:hypothetical protein